MAVTIEDYQRERSQRLDRYAATSMRRSKGSERYQKLEYFGCTAFPFSKVIDMKFAVSPFTVTIIATIAGWLIRESGCSAV